MENARISHLCRNTHKNGHLVSELLKSISAPADVAVIKCRAHQKLTMDINKGNDNADKAAREAAGLPISLVMPARLPKEQIKLHRYTVACQILLQFKLQHQWMIVTNGKLQEGQWMKMDYGLTGERS